MDEARTIEYSVAPLSRRFLALMVDLFLIILCTFLSFSLSNMALRESELFKDNEATRLAIQADTGLYINNTLITDYYDADEDTPMREKKDILANTILSFYQNETYCDAAVMQEYDARRLDAVSGVYILFKATDDGIIENDVDPSLLYNFYSDEIELHSLSYLASYPPYLETNRFELWASIIQVIIYLTLFLIIFWLVLPLTAFRRGKMSLGRKLFKVGLVGVDGLSLTGPKYLLRFLFNYFVYWILGFFAFTIPILVGAGMLIFSKRGQDLCDYTLNQYNVDARGVEIYLDEGEYLFALETKKKIHLSDPSLKDVHEL